MSLQQSGSDVKSLGARRARVVGDSVGVDWSAVDRRELVRGMKVEGEHAGGRLGVARSMKDLMKIALAHLREDPAYYRKLAKMERMAPERKTRVLKAVPRARPPRIGDVHKRGSHEYVVTGSPSAGHAELAQIGGSVRLQLTHRYMDAPTRRATRSEIAAARKQEPPTWTHPGLPGVKFPDSMKPDPARREADRLSSERAAARRNEMARARAGLFSPSELGMKADWTPEQIREENRRYVEGLRSGARDAADRAAASRSAVGAVVGKRAMRELDRASRYLPGEPAYHADYWSGHEHRLGLRKAVRIILRKGAWQQGALDLFPGEAAARAAMPTVRSRRSKARWRQPELLHVPDPEQDEFSAEWHGLLRDHAQRMSQMSALGVDPSAHAHTFTRMGIRHANWTMAEKHGLKMTMDEKVGRAVLRGVRPPPLLKASPVGRILGLRPGDKHPTMPHLAPTVAKDRDRVLGRAPEKPLPALSWGVTHFDDGPVIATYHDSAGKKQYIYTQQHRAAADTSKFEHLRHFHDQVPKVRTQVAQHIRGRDAERDRVTAAAVRLIDRAAMRVGSEGTAQERGTYGATSLRKEHVKVDGNTVTCEFPAKGGTPWKREIEDSALAATVKHLQGLPGERLFQFRKKSGELAPLHDHHVRSYMEPFGAHPHQFRAYHATRVAHDHLAGKTPANAAEAKRHVSEAVRLAAEHIGDTPSVTKAKYISPDLLGRHLRKGERAQKQAKIAPPKPIVQPELALGFAKALGGRGIHPEARHTRSERALGLALRRMHRDRVRRGDRVEIAPRTDAHLTCETLARLRARLRVLLRRLRVRR